MKETINTYAINLKSFDFSEYDKIITVYSREYGKMSCIAKNVKKINSKLGARADLFVANNYLLQKGKNLYTIKQAEADNSFFKLRTDSDKIFNAMYCLDVINHYGNDNDENSIEIYNLLYSVLNKIAGSNSKVEMLLALIRFQIKAMKVFGYSPEFEKCSVCGCEIENKTTKFSFSQGGFLCPEHYSYASIPQKIHPKLQSFFKTMRDTDFNIISDYDKLANEKVCEPCFELLKQYIEFHSPNRFMYKEK